MYPNVTPGQAQTQQYGYPPPQPQPQPAPRKPQDFLDDAIQLYNIDAGCKEARNAVLIALVIELRRLNHHNDGWR
jgi:hypothetical protein